MNVRRKKTIPIRSEVFGDENSLEQESQMTETVSVSKKIEVRQKGRKAATLFTLFIIACFAFLITDNYKKTMELRKVKDPQYQASLTEKQNQRILAQVSKYILLPQGEVPTMMTILDANAAAAEQNFYQGSVNGDVVIVYPKASRAIVWSPSRQIIVNSGPILVNDDKKDQVQAPTKSSASSTSSASTKSSADSE